MTLLSQLFQKYGTMQQMNLSLEQLHELRNGLKMVEPSEVISFEQANQFLELLKKFREGIALADALHGDNYPQLLNSLLSVGEDGVYSNNLRFIFELIQNVDDCDFPDGEAPVLDIHFDFNHDKIVLTYNEKGFTPFNVFAITGIAEAAKNVSAGKNEIGEKGIGFKSVFGVANSVLIRSGWFSFELHKANFTIPIANYSNSEYCTGTEMTLFLSTGKTKQIYNEIKTQYCNKDALFSKNPLLFLNKLTSLKMYYDSFRSMEFCVSRSDTLASSHFSKDEDVRITVSLHDPENGIDRDVVEEITCVRYSSSVAYSESACMSRYGSNTKVGSNGGKRMNLQVIFPRPECLDSVGQGALYSFLPTQMRLNVPLVCHVPFKLDASREFVDPQENNQWFQDTCHFFSELLDWAYQEWAQIVKNEIVLYLPGAGKSLIADNNGKEKCLSTQKVFKGEHFTTLPIFYTVDGNYVDIDHVFCFDRTEQIFDPEWAYRLLPVSRELFLQPERKPVFGIGIRTERNVYSRLFEQALRMPAKTTETFQYLSKANYCPAKDIIPTESFVLTEEQICCIMRYDCFASLFSDHAKECVQKKMRPLYSMHTTDFLSMQEALYQDFKRNEAPKAVEKYLSFCEEKCVLLDIGTEQFFPCNNALVLSRADPLSSFAAFCYAVDSKDTFSVRMKHREISERLNRLSESDEGSEEDYLRELRNNRLLGKEAIGQNQYNNYIDLILKSGTDRRRFLQELLQNADDCEYDEGVVPEFSFIQDKKKITVTYNERGFTRGNIRSITAIGESTKNHLMNQETSKIGEKGVGFKTIFAVAKTVQIHSGRYHFELSAKTPTIPEILEKQNSPVQGTRMDISIKSDDRLVDNNEQKILELCLCLRKLRKININGNEVSIDDTANVRTITIGKNKHTFRRFTHSFTVDGDALKERENGLRNISEKQSIVCYIPEKSAKSDYPLYCGLPTKHRIKIPVVIDAPFMLTTSREEIDTGSHLWNDRIRAEMYASLLEIMDERKYDDRYKALRFVRIKSQGFGTEPRYSNNTSDNDYLNQYNFLDDVRAATLLPTFDKSVFVSANDRMAYRYPEAVNILFREGCFGPVSASTALDIPENDSFVPTLNAIGCPEAPFEKAFAVLMEYAGDHIETEPFRKNLYACLENAPESYQESLRGLPIIPVYSTAGDRTEYIPWEDDVIFVKKNCKKSEHNYYILNEQLLPKSVCEKIFGININEMNAEWERSRYNDGLRDIIRGSDTAEIYSYLLKEFNKGSFTKYQSQEILIGMKEFIPLKNQLGKIIDTGVFICDEVTGYFQSNIILSISVHDECKKLAEYLKYPLLSSIHYQDISYVDVLTGDDIDDLSADYFVNGEEILRNFYRDGKLSDDLVAEYGLEYIAMQSSQDDDYLEFPKNPVRNFDKLRKHIQTLLHNPIKIIAVKVERTVHKCKDSSGKEFGIDDKNIRNQTLAIYTPNGIYGRCFCQMCRKVKPYDLMEVNNIIATPKYFFPQTRVALCLECSKRFEAMRHSNAQKNVHGGEDPFLLAIKQAKIGSNGYVDVSIGKESIRFTGTHLAEIQEILRSAPM